MSRKVKGGRIKIESKSFISVLEIDDEGGGGKECVRVWLSEEESEECWTGHLRTRDISKWVEKTRMEYKPYLQETVSALTGEGDFIIELVSMEEGAELRWKKRVTQDGIVLRMGSARMRRQNSAGAALEVCVERVGALEEELLASRGRCEGLEGERAALADQLEQRCQQQRRLETELFTKFALVLNEKKRKIAELLDTTPLRPSPPPPEAKPETKKVPARKPKKKAKEEFSLEAEVSSDEEDMQPIVTRQRNSRTRKQPEAVASTSKKVAEPEAEELYGGETQPMDTQQLLDDF